MVDSEMLSLNSIGNGDKFTDDSIVFYDVVPGQAYTLMFSEYEI